jgi:hypothetical protein
MVTAEHIRDVVAMSKDFKDYTKELERAEKAAQAATKDSEYDILGPHSM